MTQIWVNPSTGIHGQLMTQVGDTEEIVMRSWAAALDWEGHQSLEGALALSAYESQIRNGVLNTQPTNVYEERVFNLVGRMIAKRNMAVEYATEYDVFVAQIHFLQTAHFHLVLEDGTAHLLLEDGSYLLLG